MSDEAARGDGGEALGARVARLERELAALRDELAALRATPDAAASRPPAPAPPPPSRTPRSRAGAPPWLDRALAPLGRLPSDGDALEGLVGRYGTVLVAALLILMGVGAFVTWAVSAVTLGPAARVALGALGAAALAALGWRLRRGEGTRRFGDVLLAIALAVTHVVAWGAGPALGLAPAWLALGIAGAASAALAALAWRVGEQALFVVGVGGALVAPFVADAAAGHPFVLPTYGWVVLTAGLLALPRGADAAWTLAARLLGAGGAAYAAAMLRDAAAAQGLGGSAALSGWTPRAEVPAAFALACALAALAAGRTAVVRPTAAGGVALAHLTTTLGALVALALGRAQGAPRLAAYALAAAAAVPPVLELLPGRGALGLWRLVRPAGAALLLPLGLLVAALVALPDPVSARGAGVALAWAVVSAAASAWTRRRDARDGRVGAHAAAAGLASALVPVLFLRDADVARVVLLAAHGAAFALLAARLRERLAWLSPVLVLLAAAAWGWTLLDGRAAYAYPPFATAPSLGAAAVVAGWMTVGWRARRAAGLTAGERGVLAAAGPLALLLWGRAELGRTGSPDLATFLVVGWFALAGIVAIQFGRSRRVAAARQAGLALALYAAVKAIVQVSAIDPVGLRVGSYLLVGGFLLAVGFWYRAAGDRPAVPAPAVEPGGA